MVPPKVPERERAYARHGVRFWETWRLIRDGESKGSLIDRDFSSQLKNIYVDRRHDQPIFLKQLKTLPEKSKGNMLTGSAPSLCL